MDFERKPGSRDGKPNKGTRRHPTAQRKEHTVEVSPAQKADFFDRSDNLNSGVEDEATGMRHGVKYSVNKGARWEMVAELEKEEARNKQGKTATMKQQVLVVDEAKLRGKKGSLWVNLRQEVKHELKAAELARLQEEGERFDYCDLRSD
jgi:hypothetical protein